MARGQHRRAPFGCDRCRSRRSSDTGCAFHLATRASHDRLGRGSALASGGRARGDSGRGPVGRQRWEAAKVGLFNAYRALHRDIARMPAHDLTLATVDPRNRATGEGMSRYLTIHGVIHHATYHAGQIALLKRALRG